MPESRLPCVGARLPASVPVDIYGLQALVLLL